MRVFLYSVSLGLSLAAFAFPARAQDAQKLVEQYLKAEGGSKALSRIQTVSIEGTFTNPGDGKSGTYTFSTKLPNRFYTELVSGDVTLIEAYNGKSAWHERASGEIATLTGAEGSQLEAAGLYYNTHLMNAKKNRVGLGFAESAKVHGREAQEIEATTASGVKWRTAFDSESHLIVREQATIGGVKEELIYDDYRGVSGVKIPFKIELRRGKDAYDVVVTRAEINGRLGERVFDFPKKSQVQLPDLKGLFKEIEANQKAIDKIKENYAGTRDEEETQFDKTGKISKRELRQYDFFYLDGDEVSTLVKKEGKPLSAEDQKKENEKTQKEIENIQKRQAKKEAKEEKAKNEGKDKKDDDEVGIDTFLRASQFVNPRRERFRGQDVLVFDFEPNPEFKPHKLVEKVVHELAGVVWIDDKARDVARLEAYFVGDFHFGGGLIANLQKGTSFTFEQAYINNEVWLPTYEEAHLGARVLLLKTFKVNEVTRYSNYKKFNVESIATIGKPKGVADSAAPAPPADPAPTSTPKPD